MKNAKKVIAVLVAAAMVCSLAACSDSSSSKGKKDKKEIAQKLQQQALMGAQQFMGDLVRNANVKDNRYIFF